MKLSSPLKSINIFSKCGRCWEAVRVVNVVIQLLRRLVERLLAVPSASASLLVEIVLCDLAVELL